MDSDNEHSAAVKRPQLISQLRDQIDQVLHLMEDPSFQALTPLDRNTLRDHALKLSQKLVRAENEALTIGLLGGTGVGKSTILNAIAGSKISDASHRRPWTDHVLIYRHEAAQGLPPEQLNRIPWQEHIHSNPSIGEMLLCDLPDFDSIQTEHYKRVLTFLEHLDLLIWVTSPEKYADQKFHDFLAAAPKAQQNYFFVLNKIDLIFDGQPSEKGFEEIAAMSEAFQNRLRGSGVLDPLVFLVSAKDGNKGQTMAPWNQFPTFKKQVFQERRVKEVMVVKAANLDVEVQSLLRQVQQGIISLKTFEKVLMEITDQFQLQRSVWADEWERTLEGWTESNVNKRMRAQRPDPVPLLGPGFGLALFMDGIKNNLRRAEEASPDLSQLSISDAMIASFKIHLQWLEARMERQRLQKSLPESFLDKTTRILEIPKRLESFKNALSKTLAWHLGEASWPSFMGFKIWQGFWYVLVLAVFIVALGGHTPWKDLVETPGVKNFVNLVFSFIHTLFSTKGLAALGTYMILNLFLGLRFYKRFSVRIQRIAHQRMRALKASLKAAWETEVASIDESLHKALQEVQAEKTKIAAITKSST